MLGDAHGTVRMLLDGEVLATVIALAVPGPSGSPGRQKQWQSEVRFRQKRFFALGSSGFLLLSVDVLMVCWLYSLYCAIVVACCTVMLLSCCVAVIGYCVVVSFFVRCIVMFLFIVLLSCCYCTVLLFS